MSEETRLDIFFGSPPHDLSIPAEEMATDATWEEFLRTYAPLFIEGERG
jgi:hypothetical protein